VTTKKLAAEKQGSDLQKQAGKMQNPGNEDSQNLNALSVLQMFSQLCKKAICCQSFAKQRM
jgi:hypothetical protein